MHVLPSMAARAATSHAMPAAQTCAQASPHQHHTRGLLRWSACRYRHVRTAGCSRSTLWHGTDTGTCMHATPAAGPAPGRLPSARGILAGRMQQAGVARRGRGGRLLRSGCGACELGVAAAGAVLRRGGCQRRAGIASHEAHLARLLAPLVLVGMHVGTAAEVARRHLPGEAACIAWRSALAGCTDVCHMCPFRGASRFD